jgi:hypothetical protein
MSGAVERRKAGKRGRRQGDQSIPVRDPSPNLPRGLRNYRVRIIYTEPEFQERNPHCPLEFSFSRECPGAGSLDEAVKQAVGYFDFCAENSSVRWRRIIKSVTVEPS